MNKKYVLIPAIAVLAVLGVTAAEGPVKVPDEIGVKILNAKLDQEKAKERIASIQSQYNTAFLNAVAADQAIYNNDQTEIDKLNKQALDKLKLPDDKYVVDDDKLEVSPKSAEVKK